MLVVVQAPDQRTEGGRQVKSSRELMEIVNAYGGLTERVGPVDDRRHLPRLDELLQDQQVVAVLA